MGRITSSVLHGACLTCALTFVWVSAAGGQEASRQPIFELGVHEGVPWPIIPAPLWPLPVSPRWSAPRPAAATPAAQKILEVLAHIEATARDTRYEHVTRVRERDGVYRWDCSGMAAWILARAAPVAMRTLQKVRPVARDFARVIERAPTHRARGGWQRVERVSDLQPGDVFSWRRPRGFPSRNTGHVGFVVDRPLVVPGMLGAYAVRIADATSNGHQDDSRAQDPDGGFGVGTVVFLTDEVGRGTHYGWYGTHSDAYVTTPILLGRVVR